MLSVFIATHRDEIIERCRARMATRPMPTAADVGNDHGIPQFVDALIEALPLRLTSSPEIGRSARLHGQNLLLQGFPVSQVVHDYGDVFQAITDLAVESNVEISTEDFRLLNRCLDDAMADAVTEYGGGETNPPSTAK